MTNNKIFIEIPKTYTQCVVENKVQEVKLPTIEQIRERQSKGESALTREEKELIQKGYRQELIVYPSIWDESDSAHTFENGFETLSVSTKGRIEGGADSRVHASVGADLSTFRYRDGVGDLKLFNYSASAEAGMGADGVSAKYKLGVDLVSVKAKGAKVNVGVDFGSEVSVGEGSIKGKVAGVGISIGKEIGISTPVGGFSVNLEETAENCTTQ